MQENKDSLAYKIEEDKGKNKKGIVQIKEVAKRIKKIDKEVIVERKKKEEEVVNKEANKGISTTIGLKKNKKIKKKKKNKRAYSSSSSKSRSREKQKRGIKN